MKEDDEVAAAAEDAGWLTRGVTSIGVASFGSDAGHEITTSLLPTFLTSTLHAGPAALGAIEGVSDALVGLSKLAGGPLSSDPAKRGRIASGGYLVTALATGAIGLAVTVWQVALLRAAAWISRGLRSPARDSLLMSLVPRSAYGRASGLERAGDNAGALAGPLLASVLVATIGIRPALLVAFIPGLIAAGAITVAATEARRTLAAPAGRRTLSLNLKELRKAGLMEPLGAIATFELANVATTLLILRATQLLDTDARTTAAATSIAILMYAGHNAAAAVTSLYAGHFVDRIGPRPVLAGGAAVYVGSYALFAWQQHGWVPLLAGFVLAGIGIGCAETAQTSLVALALPDRLRGNGFGLLGLVQSFGDLGATVVAGLLWSAMSGSAAFVYLTGWMAAAALITAFGRRLTAPAA
jgi:MFS family permease